MALQPIKHKEPASGRKANNTVAMRSAGERLLPAVNAMDLSISFMDMEEVIGFEALYDSMHKCKKGVIWKESVAHYVLNSLEETYKLNEQLENETYKARQIAKFTITRPKKREIISVCFRDRVYQRSLNDNALYPIMTNSFIRDNWACQRGKGTDDARDRMKIFLQRMYRKYGTDFYGLQCDIHGYYPNMRHDLTKELFRDKLDDWLYEQTATVLDGQYAGDVGYNPGSQMIQIAGITFLSEYDHMMRKQTEAEDYGRYMDDSTLFHPSKEYLENLKLINEKYLASRGMEYNSKKTKVFSIKEGFTFLGFKYRLTDTGKVIMTVSSEKVKERRRKLRKLVRKAKRGEITKAKVDDCYQAWRSHASKGNSFHLIRRMDKFYKSLWNDQETEVTDNEN